MPKRNPSKKKEKISDKPVEDIDGVSQVIPRKRILRACDRCKIKKSKCDGGTPCQNCLTSDSECRYSARRRREARDLFLQYREVYEQALQKLYWACRQKSDFPGTIPDESKGYVTTEEILQGLGLWGDIEVESDGGPMTNLAAVMPSTLKLDVPDTAHFGDVAANLSSQSSPGSIPTSLSSISGARFFKPNTEALPHLRYTRADMRNRELGDMANDPQQRQSQFSWYDEGRIWQNMGNHDSNHTSVRHGPGVMIDPRMDMMPADLSDPNESMFNGYDAPMGSDYVMDSYTGPNKAGDHSEGRSQDSRMFDAGAKQDGIMPSWTERTEPIPERRISKGKRRE